MNGQGWSAPHSTTVASSTGSPTHLRAPGTRTWRWQQRAWPLRMLSYPTQHFKPTAPRSSSALPLAAWTLSKSRRDINLCTRAARHGDDCVCQPAAGGSPAEGGACRRRRTASSHRWSDRPVAPLSSLGLNPNPLSHSAGAQPGQRQEGVPLFSTRTASQHRLGDHGNRAWLYRPQLWRRISVRRRLACDWHGASSGALKLCGAARQRPSPCHSAVRSC